MSTERIEYQQRFDAVRAALGQVEEFVGRIEVDHERTMGALCVYRDNLESDLETLGQKLCVAIELYAAAAGMSQYDAYALVNTTHANRIGEARGNGNGNGLGLTMDAAAKMLGYRSGASS